MKRHCYKGFVIYRTSVPRHAAFKPWRIEGMDEHFVNMAHAKAYLNAKEQHQCATCNKTRVVCDCCRRCNECGHHPACTKQGKPLIEVL